jgi:hypothetical protein
MTTVSSETQGVHPPFVPQVFDAETAGAFVGKVVTDCAATVSVARWLAEPR